MNNYAKCLEYLGINNIAPLQDTTCTVQLRVWGSQHSTENVSTALETSWNYQVVAQLSVKVVCGCGYHPKRLILFFGTQGAQGSLEHSPVSKELLSWSFTIPIVCEYVKWCDFGSSEMCQCLGRKTSPDKDHETVMVKILFQVSSCTNNSGAHRKR